MDYHMFRFQTLLTSKQLSAYLHLPEQETRGFSVRRFADFDVIPPRAEEGRSLQLGKVLRRGHTTGGAYAIPTDSLTKHAFVAGVTGSGKSTTIRLLLRRAAELGVPFLVVEPAKTEYRNLTNDPVLNGMRVLTAGRETVAPLRLNPFEVVGWPRVSVQEHLDLLRSAFSVAFGMWTPLPQVLEQCLHLIYSRRGWDLLTDHNARCGSSPDHEMFPCMSDLLEVLPEVSGRLDYEQRIVDNIRAALHTRVLALTEGGKGSMLDVQATIPMGELLSQCAVLELEGLGDDDDKAFVMAMLFVQLAEWRRAQGLSKSLRHILVLEEAHRLLAHPGPPGGEGEANPRQKAVEVFANLLSEIRAYGQGVIIADQIPTKLAPDVIKNTNVKIAHRVVAREDREALAGAMAMDDSQAASLSALTTGQAAVFASHGKEADDAPVMVAVEFPTWLHDAESSHASDLDIREGWEAWIQARNLLSYYALSACDAFCGERDRRCRQMKGLSAEGRSVSAFQSFLLTLVGSVHTSGFDDVFLDRAYSELSEALRPVLASKLCSVSQLDTRCLTAQIAHRVLGSTAARRQWPYRETAELEALLLPYLLCRARGGDDVRDAISSVERFCSAFLSMSTCCGPFGLCEELCLGICLFREAVREYAADRELTSAFRDAFIEHGPSGELWGLCKSVAYLMLQATALDPSRVRVGLCFALHQADSWAALPRSDRQRLVRSLQVAAITEEEGDTQDDLA